MMYLLNNFRITYIKDNDEDEDKYLKKICSATMNFLNKMHNSEQKNCKDSLVLKKLYKFTSKSFLTK